MDAYERSGLEHNKPDITKSIINHTLSKFFTRFAHQNVKPFVSNHDQLKKFAFEVQEQNRNKIFDGNELKIKGWKHFSLTSGQRSPFHLS